LNIKSIIKFYDTKLEHEFSYLYWDIRKNRCLYLSSILRRERELYTMYIHSVIEQRPVYQQYRKWFVLDEEFPWDLYTLQKHVYSCLNQSFLIPVVFCDSCEANKIVSDLGEEEAEYLYFASGLYWREVGIIFIFKFDAYIPLIEVLFHELRHVMQDSMPVFQKQFELDKHLPYEERITERDAYSYAKYQVTKFIKHNQYFPYENQVSDI
jgi:hypothetical protein